jgi:hypothetical protein
MEGYSLDRVAAVQWGKQHEETAFGEFKAATGLSFEPSGLWLHPCGLFGASPDGVGEDFVIEAKCPYKFRNAASLKDVVDKNYCFWYEGDVTVVNTNHQYYHQVQGQLHLLDKAVCYMVIWTPQYTQIFSINKDEDWAENLNTLIEFYIKKYVTHNEINPIYYTSYLF